MISDGHFDQRHYRYVLRPTKKCRCDVESDREHEYESYPGGESRNRRAADVLDRGGAAAGAQRGADILALYSKQLRPRWIIRDDPNYTAIEAECLACTRLQRITQTSLLARWYW